MMVQVHRSAINVECVVGVNRRNGDYSNQRGWLCVTPNSSIVSWGGTAIPHSRPTP
jgi:hypothetical protein